MRTNAGCLAATGIGERGGVLLGKSCTSLRSLCLPACDKLTPPVLEALVLGCTSLVSLNIGYTGTLNVIHFDWCCAYGFSDTAVKFYILQGLW